ncbi:glycosyltransferase [Gammaproteobacteria bacterium]|nr:glycosyltransferase [Gammaproteobacteria bacterium]
MNGEFYILLPVYNRKEVTRRFVQCLKSQSYTKYHLVLIDDGSTDGTAEMVREYIPSVIVLRGKGDWWWAGGLQKGIDWLREREVDDSAIILFANDDVTFGPDYLEMAGLVMNERSGLLLLSKFSCDGGTVVAESGIVADFRRLTFKTASAEKDVNCLSTRGLFVRFGDLNCIGDFYPFLLPHYLSDYEYTIRAVRKGMRCETSDLVFLCPNPDTTGYHHNFKERNFFSFLKKYFSIKSAGNPVYWSVFVILSAPAPWIVPNLARIWFRSIKEINKRLFYLLREVFGRNK